MTQIHTQQTITTICHKRERTGRLLTTTNLVHNLIARGTTSPAGRVQLGVVHLYEL
jgi:hypothetical protein